MEMHFLFLAKKSSSISAFYDRDDVSRVTTGRKQTITRNKVKKQKRFLVDTLLNLHRKFLSENAKRATLSFADFVPSGLYIQPFKTEILACANP